MGGAAAEPGRAPAGRRGPGLAAGAERRAAAGGDRRRATAEAWARAARGLAPEPREVWMAWFCTYTPLELILAAGLEPSRMLGTPGGQGGADAYLTPNLCPYVRSVLAQAMSGTHPRAAVIAASCNAMTHLFSAWTEFVGTPAYLLDLPRRPDAPSLEHFARSLGDLLAWLEGIGGVAATPARLEVAGETVEAARRALRSAHLLALAPDPVISGETLLEMVRAAQTAPPAQFTAAAARFLEEVGGGAEERVTDDAATGAAAGAAAGLLCRAAAAGGHEAEPRREIAPALQTAPGLQTRPRPGHGPRLLVTGSLLDPGLVRVVEEAGAQVVADDLCLGSRGYLEEPAAEAGAGPGAGTGPCAGPRPAAGPDQPGEAQPRTREEWLRALAERYLARRPPCPRAGGFERRARHLDQLLAAAQPDGVVAYGLKFCDNALYDFPALRAHLSRARMPALFLVQDYGGGDLGQVRTRVEAFLETLSV